MCRAVEEMIDREKGEIQVSNIQKLMKKQNSKEETVFSISVPHQL